jgi:hypothetical protein
MTPEKDKKQEVDLTLEQLAQADAKNKSQIIRYLDSKGYARAAIARFLDIRYQHVRKVLVTPQKRLIAAERAAARALLNSDH